MSKNKKIVGVFLLIILLLLFAGFFYCNENEREKFTIEISEDKKNTDKNSAEDNKTNDVVNGDTDDGDAGSNENETLNKNNKDKSNENEDSNNNETLNKNNKDKSNENEDSNNNEHTEKNDIENGKDKADEENTSKEGLYKHKDPQKFLSVNYEEKKIYLKKTGSFYSQETFESEFPGGDFYAVYTDKRGRRVKEEEIINDVIINTIIRKYYDTGETYLRAEYGKNNTPKKVIVYHKNSYVKAEEIYIYGELKLITMFNENGQKIREERYSDGTINNAVNYTKDVITKEEYYNKVGQAQGWWVYRADSGVKIKEEHYENGILKEYVLYRYNRKGQKIADEIYENGELVEYFSYKYTDKYIIQERYVPDEKSKNKKDFILMERIQFENK